MTILIIHFLHNHFVNFHGDDENDSDGDRMTTIIDNDDGCRCRCWCIS